ncbi:hypothetical protein QL285_004580 [Trifolium repens]|nr:hypothetical protein QL285_004580 [Trifolium repens]
MDATAEPIVVALCLSESVTSYDDNDDDSHSFFLQQPLFLHCCSKHRILITCLFLPITVAVPDLAQGLDFLSFSC